MILSGRPWS